MKTVARFAKECISFQLNQINALPNRPDVNIRARKRRPVNRADMAGNGRKPD
jgi:hypothetical protein